MKRLLLLWTLLVGLLLRPTFAAELVAAAQPLEAAGEPFIAPAGWVLAPGTLADVHADPADYRVAERLARHAAEAVPRLADTLGVGVGPKMQIVVAPDNERLQSLQPGRVPEWADGTAWPDRGLIFLRSPRIRPGTAPPLEQVLDHEVVHVLLGQAFGPRPVPRWLQEGVAKVLAREYTPDMTDALAGGVLGGELLSLDELTRGFPANSLRARLAYAQSADFIAFLQNHYGPDTLPALVDQMAAGRDADEALRAVTGLSLGALEAAWRGRLAASPLWLKPLTAPELWWGLAAVLFVFGGLRVRRARRATLARWAREEALQEAVIRALAQRMAERARERERLLLTALPPRALGEPCTHCSH